MTTGVADLLSYDAARDRILAAAKPLEGETRPLASAAGHCLAQTIVARLTQPPFDASAMDGYAVPPGAAPGVPLRLVGRSEAGAGWAGTLGAGQAVRIFTGAPVPAGTESVVMQEDVTANGDTINPTALPKPGQHLRRKGNDFASGAPLLAAGTCLTPAAVALCAAAGHGQLTVTRRPRLALLMTGDELVPPGALPGPDQIIASNGAGLAGLFGPLTQAVDDLGIVGDDSELLRQSLGAALAGPADVIVTTGGASVGDRDLVRPVLAELGVTLDLWRIAMRPGKPLMFARAGDKLIFGLPGNPVSALTTALVLVAPALRALAGDSNPGPHFVTLKLAEDVGPNGPRRHFRRARLVAHPDGTRIAPLAETDSAHLSSLAAADCLMVHQEHSPPLSAGTPVSALLLT